MQKIYLLDELNIGEFVDSSEIENKRIIHYPQKSVIFFSKGPFNRDKLDRVVVNSAADYIPTGCHYSTANKMTRVAMPRPFFEKWAQDIEAAYISDVIERNGAWIVDVFCKEKPLPEKFWNEAGMIPVFGGFYGARPETQAPDEYSIKLPIQTAGNYVTWTRDDIVEHNGELYFQSFACNGAIGKAVPELSFVKKAITINFRPFYTKNSYLYAEDVYRKKISTCFDAAFHPESRTVLLIASCQSQPFKYAEDKTRIWKSGQEWLFVENPTQYYAEAEVKEIGEEQPVNLMTLKGVARGKFFLNPKSVFSEGELSQKQKLERAKQFGLKKEVGAASRKEIEEFFGAESKLFPLNKTTPFGWPESAIEYDLLYEAVNCGAVDLTEIFEHKIPKNKIPSVTLDEFLRTKGGPMFIFSKMKKHEQKMVLDSFVNDDIKNKIMTGILFSA